MARNSQSPEYDSTNILIVDDDPATTAALETMLRDAGYTALCAHTLADAEVLADKNSISLVVLDVMLPDGNGLDLCRKWSATKDFPILFISSLDDLDTKIRGFTAGGLDFITKPLAVEEVLARVRTHLRLKSAQDDLAAQQHQLRELSLHLQNGWEKENQRIAVWLHDEIGQKLTGVRLDAVRLKDTQVAPEESRRILGHVKTAIEEIVEDIRTLATALHPSMLEDIGLVDTLKWSIAEDRKRLNIPIAFTVKDVPSALNKDMALAFYRVARECMTNISRHAKASRVSVSLKGANGKLELVVHDNGRGFPSSKCQAGTSFGLHQMRERACVLSGTLTIDSRPGHGTEVCFSAPIEMPTIKGDIV